MRASDLLGRTEIATSSWRHSATDDDDFGGEQRDCARQRYPQPSARTVDDIDSHGITLVRRASYQLRGDRIEVTARHATECCREPLDHPAYRLPDDRWAVRQSFGAAKVATSAARALRLQDQMPDLAGHRTQPIENSTMGNDRASDTSTDGDAERGVGARRGAELILGKRERLGIVD